MNEERAPQEASIRTTADIFEELQEIIDNAPGISVVEVVRHVPYEYKLDTAPAALAAKLVIGRMQKYLKG